MIWRHMMPNNINKMLEVLVTEIENDTFNLTRNDHEAIRVKICELKEFIQKQYEQHQHTN